MTKVPNTLSRRTLGDPTLIKPLCAVEGCTNTGKCQTCPADGQYHGHGRIHYEYCHTDLKFRVDTSQLAAQLGAERWYLICDEHFKICVAARRAWEEAMSTKRMVLAMMLGSTPCDCEDEVTCPHEQIKILRREIAALERS